MQCHECDADAVGQCRFCGKGFCGGHGADLCRGCATGIVAAEPNQTPVARQAYLQCVSRPRMPTVYLDDDGPPECYRCQAYARFVCQNCHNLYCAEHGSKDLWCEQCTVRAKKSWMVMVVIFGFLIAFALLVFLLNSFKLG